MKVTLSKDHTADLLKTIQSMIDKQVLVGIPAQTANRNDGSETSNALIGYALETGIPEHNLPARPFLIPGVKSVQKTVTEVLKKAGMAALSGDNKAFEMGLTKVGLMAVGAVKDKMDVGPFAPLANATLRARIRKGGGSQAGAEEELANRLKGGAAGTSLAQPLIDTGSLQNSITFVIRKKGDR